MQRSWRAARGGGLIERGTPRAVFAELMGRALGDLGIRPTPMATAYLIELLDQQVRVPAAAPDESEPTLAEDLLTARLERGAARIDRLRRLGDRALFVSGFFGDSLTRSAVGIGYYGEAGRAAYAALAAELFAELREPTWPCLFEELADCFREFADALGEVGDRALRRRPVDLLRLYDRYLQTGSERDWRRLLRRGHVPPRWPGLRRWQ